MTLSERPRLRTALLCLLYFCQGFPWGFATIALLATLSEAGFDKAETATITAMAMLPWTFKFFWAPMIDSLRLPSLGIRRPWIILAQLGMAITLFGAWSSGVLESEGAIVYLSWVLFCHNCFASLQDVATDALALDVLDEQERGRVLGYMWGSKVVGISAGGAGLAIVISRTNIETAIVLQALIILAVCMLVMAVRERSGERLFPWTMGSAQGAGTAARQFGLTHTIVNLKRALSKKVPLVLTLVAVTVLINEGFYAPLTTEFFVQKLGWTAEAFSGVMGTWGVTGELVGALTGGFLASRFSSRMVAMFGIALMSGSLLLFSLTAAGWDSPDYPHAALLPAFRGSVAFTTVALFAVYMKSCWTAAAATQFTLYMALTNIGYTVGSKLNAWLPAMGLNLDFEQSYLVGACLPLAGFILLLTIDPDAESYEELEPQTA